MTDGEEQAIYAAYLTIAVLKRRCIRNGLTEEAEFATSAMDILGQKFSFIAIRAAKKWRSPV